MKDKRVSRISYILFFAVFFAVSVLYISPDAKTPRSEYRSSQLHQVITRDGNVQKVEYIDDQGIVRVAADLGYARRITTKTEDGVLETFYDDEGNRVKMYAGQYAVFRKYDDAGNNTLIMYLDLDGSLLPISQGYAVEEREYNKDGLLIGIRYYDTEKKPMNVPSYGYGKRFEYHENGQTYRITFLDAYGNPMVTKLGYAMMERYYDEPDESINGKVLREFFFDEAGNPVRLSLGQCGVYKEYDSYGRESVLTYLDAEGKPIKTNKGYTTVKRTFQANDSVAEERYFDLEGNPFSLSEGRYGVKNVNGRTSYLNRNGEEKLNLRTLLYNHSWIAVLSASVFLLLSALIDKKWAFILMIAWLGVIAYLTLMFRESGEGELSFGLFRSYRSVFANSELRADIIKNIWLFIPLGAVLYRLCPKSAALLIPFALSILIEAIQYTAGIGYCELDDVISNGLGGIVGYGMCKQLYGLKHDFIRRNDA